MPEELSGSQAIVRVLKEEGVPQIFGVHGGHIWSMLGVACEAGIRMMHMRHEQSGAYAADGWGRASRRPGVCFGTAGPGLYNMVGALSHTYLSRSPVVAIVGQHGTTQDGWGPFQEAYGEDVCRTFTKWSKRVIDTSMVSYWMQKAFRDAVAYPPGPVLVEIPVDVMGALGQNPRKALQAGYMAKEEIARPEPAQGNPGEVEKAVRMLLEAEKPIVVAGGGVYWADASEELKEFAEWMNIPVHTRRIARGAVPENHPLAFTGGYRRPIFGACDVMLLVGHNLNILEGFGQPPTYGRKTKYIQVAESEEEFSPMIPAKISIWGNPKQVLRQMMDCAKSLKKEPPKRKEWLETISKAREAYRKQQREEAEAVRTARPMNPRFMAQEVVDFLDDSATVIYDSFTFVAFVTDRIEAKFAGQILDAGTYGGVGHAVGMGIGAQLARPGRQVIGLIGDGGVGVAGFDIETAARYKIPVVYFVFNNSGWLPNTYQKLVCPTMDPWGMLEDIRYDKVFAEMGCHTEWVTEPEQIRPALERAFNSGKTAVINALPDKTVLAPLHEARLKVYRGEEKDRLLGGGR
jgi:acetolactate synthase-1/2/3 large subunit